MYFKFTFELIGSIIKSVFNCIPGIISLREVDGNCSLILYPSLVVEIMILASLAERFAQSRFQFSHVNRRCEP